MRRRELDKIICGPIAPLAGLTPYCLYYGERFRAGALALCGNDVRRWPRVIKPKDAKRLIILEPDTPKR